MILAIGVAAIVLIAVNAVLFTALHLREATTDVVDAATPVDQAVTFLQPRPGMRRDADERHEQSFVRQFSASATHHQRRHRRAGGGGNVTPRPAR